MPKAPCLNIPLFLLFPSSSLSSSSASDTTTTTEYLFCLCLGPFMSPVPYRGQVAHPGQIASISFAASCSIQLSLKIIYSVIPVLLRVCSFSSCLDPYSSPIFFFFCHWKLVYFCRSHTGYCGEDCGAKGC